MVADSHVCHEDTVRNSCVKMRSAAFERNGRTGEHPEPLRGCADGPYAL